MRGKYEKLLADRDKKHEALRFREQKCETGAKIEEFTQEITWKHAALRIKSLSN